MERIIILSFDVLLKLFISGVFIAAQFVSSTGGSTVMHYLQVALVTVLSSLCHFVLVFISTCDDRLMGQREGGLLKRVVSCLGSCAIFYAWGVMLMFGVLGFVLVYVTPTGNFSELATTTAGALAFGWLAHWPLFKSLALFAFYRRREKAALEKAGQTTADGINIATLKWWQDNEFPCDSEASEEPPSGGEGTDSPLSSAKAPSLSPAAADGPSMPLQNSTSTHLSDIDVKAPQLPPPASAAAHQAPSPAAQQEKAPAKSSSFFGMITRAGGVFSKSPSQSASSPANGTTQPDELRADSLAASEGSTVP
jgi:hypothetical protein